MYLKIRVNPGGHYNNVTGEYTCEKTGVYYFSYTIYGWHIEEEYSHSKASASLVKGNALQGSVYLHNYDNEPIYMTLSQSLVLQCNAGEKVWVESRVNNNYIFGDSDRNMFAGVLLFMN